ncbi:MAG TPA: amino acid adenylation domain-containing protein, partial [Pseudonocardiaceae bacterium]|nr:amino acid adenylation domain-containing protein [Pseudonocardiaceae bacterium]
MRDADLAVFDHQDLPFDLLVEAVNPTRSTAHHPLFQVMLLVQNNAEGDAEFAGLRTGDYPVSAGVAKFDLTLAARERFDAEGAPAGLAGAIEFATDLFDRATVDALSARFALLLAQLSAQPTSPVSDVDVLTLAERRRFVIDANDTDTGEPDVRITDLVEQWADRTPDKAAVIFEDTTLTYRDWDSAANQLARHLAGLGTGRGDLVGVLLPRGLDLAVTVLAVLKTGAGYVPLDPEFPDERLIGMAQDSGMSLLVSDADLAHRLTGTIELRVVAPADGVTESPANPRLPGVPGDAACLMFTSGSTGRPKGALGSHRSLVGTLVGQGCLDFGADQVWLQAAPISWDAFVLEFWSALLSGATCVLQPGQRPEPDRMTELVARHGVTSLFLSAGLLPLVVDEYPRMLAGVCQVLTGGDMASTEHIDKALRLFPGLRLVNGYGPVESMIFTHTYEVTGPTGGTPLPVGLPAANRRGYVLDERLRLVPPGVPGELYVAGTGLADGYLHRAGLSAERFVADPFGGPGARMYRTGDRARWSARGEVELLGRTDDQVKIHGFRVEPAEVEAVLAAHATVGQVSVVPRVGPEGDKRLVAYVVPNTEISVARLRADITRVLPAHLVPSAFVLMDALPLTANGKIDRKALPEPDYTSGTSGRAARTPREQILCDVFADVLGVPEVGIDDGFFDLGGHSLLAVRLISRVRTVLGVDVAIRDLFGAPTVAGLDRRIGELAGQPVRPSLVPMVRPDVIPLSYAQRRLWFLAELAESSRSYNVSVVQRLSGALNVPALAAALGDVVARHEVLRTVFPAVDGEPFQVVLGIDEARPSLLVEDIGVDADRLRTAVESATGHTFDLSGEIPIRAWLFGAGPDEHVLIVLLHHIAGDGWSMGPLLGDLAAAYVARCAGSAPTWRPLPVQYADYTLWQYELLGEASDEDSVLAGQLAFWRDTLAGAPDVIELPTDRPRPPVADHVGDQVLFDIDALTHERLARLAASSGATLFMVVQAAFALLLSRLGAGTDIPIGTA